MASSTFFHTSSDAVFNVGMTTDRDVTIEDGGGNNLHVFFKTREQMVEFAEKILEWSKQQEPDAELKVWRETNGFAAALCGIEPGKPFESTE